MNVPDYLHPLVHQILQQEDAGACMRRNWAVVLGLQIKQDGNQFCILWGENLQTGVAGFGATPVEAIADFEIAMYKKAAVFKKNE